MEDFLQSKGLKKTIVYLSIVLLAVFCFGLGIYVGLREADLSFEWAESYGHNFGGPNMGPMGMTNFQRDFTDPNGGTGKIIQIEDGSITIQDSDNTEKKFLIDQNTSFVSQHQNMHLSNLKVGDCIVVIGSPESSGDISARFIRMLPCPQQ
jgi:hypothetical protein